MIKTEGIVLHSFDFKENQKIVTLFTEDAGKICLIMTKKTGNLGLTTPFSKGEYIYTKGKSDLYRFYDGTVLDNHILLRSSLVHLQAAGELTNAILRSQMPTKPAPLLYALLKTYLFQIPGFPDPTPLLCSFYLKLLKHEGILNLDDLPEICLTLLATTRFSDLKTLVLPASLKQEILAIYKSII